VHRAKGLEYDVVVLVAPREDVRDQLMYVGASRAITRLVVVAPKPLFARMGIA
jgi:ATP-dependent exoDNAse (exonuclease V) alpha subunit